MSNRSYIRARVLLTTLAAALAAGWIGWEHANGGIGSHHLLAQSDMPSISNAWALLVLPALAWVASARLFTRTTLGRNPHIDARALTAAGLAFAYGVALSVSFLLGVEWLSSVLFFGLLGLAVAIRLYRPELAFGFVVGMALTFGPVLPAIIASLAMLLSLALHPAARYGIRVARRAIPAR